MQHLLRHPSRDIAVCLAREFDFLKSPDLVSICAGNFDGFLVQ